jgi:hypothetical protein
MCQNRDNHGIFQQACQAQHSWECHRSVIKYTIAVSYPRETETPPSHTISGNHAMLAIKKARKLIETNPGDPAAQIIAALVLALESEAPLSVAQLYSLDDKRFELALEILNEWRLDRHYASKLRLLDSSTMVQALGELAPDSPATRSN